MSNPLIYSITSPSWNSIIAVNYGKVSGTREPTKYMLRWNLNQVLKYCAHRGFIIEQVK